MPRVLAHGPLRRPILLIVMAAWLLSQALGLVHRVVHPDHSAHALEATYEPRGDAHEHESLRAHGLEHLFGSHGPDTSACELYDQLAHADFLWSSPVDPCAAAVAAAVRAERPAWHIAAQAAGYLARGPPRLA